MNVIEKLKSFLAGKHPRVAVIRLSGVIAARGGSLGRKGLCLESLAPALDRAFKIPKLSAVVLIINSPGGSPVQSALIGKRIRDLSAEKGLPVVAFCEDAAASGGYWLACAADEIYADANSIVGSIGVIFSGFGFQEAIAKLGVERRVHTAGEKKLMLDPFTAEQSDDVERLKAIQGEIHDNFIAWVKERRGDKLKDSDEALFSGEFWTGAKAVELGLIDGLAEAKSEMKRRFGDKVRLIPVGPRRRLFALPGLGAQATGAFALESDELAAGLLEAAEKRAHWQRFGL